MKKTILYKTLFFCWAILALTGCDLDLQKNYDYEPSVDDPYVKVTAWEYFQDHKDMFSELIAAIEYTGLKDYYTQTDNKYTFLALNNAGMQLYRENEFAGAASITDCDKEKVTNMLLYHISPISLTITAARMPPSLARMWLSSVEIGRAHV